MQQPETQDSISVPDPAASGGEWAVVELLGHRQRAGYVTEVTRFGAALLHIDLPAKLWGGDQDAWEEYTPAALYGLHPATEQALRSAWEREQERLRQQREWDAQQRQALALPPGDVWCGDDPGEDQYAGSGYAGEQPF